MRYSTNINNVRSEEWGLNLYEAAVFAWLYECQSWADTFTEDGKIYFHTSRHLAVQELPFVTDKPDTMYRHYKSLVEKGLIETIRIKNKECVRVLDKGKAWNLYPKDGVGKKSELDQNSEKNPSEVGKFSEHTILSNTTRILEGFFSSQFSETWILWIGYKKKQHKFKYADDSYERLAVKKLHEMSKGSEIVAKQIVEHTIANGWMGFVEPKTPQPNESTTQPHVYTPPKNMINK